MEAISSLQGSSTNATFDDCLKAEGQRIFGRELMHCYFEGKFSNKCLELIHTKSLTKYLHQKGSKYDVTKDGR